MEEPVESDTSKEEVKAEDKDKGTTESSEVKEEVKEEAKDDDDELELLDLTDYKNAIKKTQGTAKKPTRKKASMEKAQAMLFKAEKELKEENND
ncbi:MAG: hypothetical protein J6Y09_03635 [Lachnospiraceae bacterium]|nr:hypothetical protein [Lachnospiraceae bacterium]